MAERWTAKKIEQILALAQDVISLNATIPNDDEDTELQQFIEDEGPTPEEIVLQEEAGRKLREFMAKFLSPREMQVLFMRYGFDTETPLTLQEIGNELGLSRERVRQIEARALRRLRSKFMYHNITRETL